ncbi:DUF4913 domain-containing protein [Nocardia sp. NPDC004711]
MTDTTPEFGSLGEFVTRLLAHSYARQVTDINDTVWCPQWWQHPEAVRRFGALWQTYEHARRSGDPALRSFWWIDHAGPHMRELFDRSGPFRYCSVRNGHQDYLQPLPTDLTDAPRELFHPTITSATTTPTAVA